MVWSSEELTKARFWAEPLQVREVPSREALSNLKVGFIGSHRLKINLEFDCSIYTLTRQNFRSVIASSGLDFILFEPALNSNRKEWDAAATDYYNNLEALSQIASQSGVPLVYWDTLGEGYDSIFSPIWSLFPYRYTADSNRGGEWRQLEPAIQPALHNPFRHRGDVTLFSVPVLFDGMVDISRRSRDFEFLELINNEELCVFDSRYTMFPNKIQELDSRFSNVLGHLPVELAYKAYKFSRYYLTVSTTQKEPVARLFDCIEAAACGAWVLDAGPEYIKGTFKGLFQKIPKDDLQKWLKNTSGEEWNAQRQLNLRALVLNHTYAHRLSKLCDDLGVSNEEPRFPKISIITPSNRPHLSKKIVTQFINQTYSKKELVYVYNANRSNEISDVVESVDNLKFYSLPPEMNIGSCMNYAISKATGEFCVKMDDDDFYGNNYLLDIFVCLKCIAADFWGKPPSFIYFQSTDELYFRENSNRRAVPYSFCLGKELGLSYKMKNSKSLVTFNLAGNTLGGQASSLLRHKFSVSNVGAVDTIFHDMEKKPNSVVAVMCCGNMAVYRDENLEAHNWRVSENQLKGKAKLIGRGMKHEKVFY
ncbi:glycosyltransferase [Halomonas sp. M20]|uniref:glycosyltransferase n=1 Tax=Halomonas sp. M20 TaxID=2763264 RepID=UPI001D0B0F9B|nr:glycosyltransferase [Halomonas sp. M20]